MEHELLILAAAFFGASVLQTATGIGFGIIAGPVLLLILNSASAIQISVLQSFLICAALAPGLRGAVEMPLLKTFARGSAVGIPLGGLVYFAIGIDLLKILAGLAVLATLVFVLRGNGGSKAAVMVDPGGDPESGPESGSESDPARGARRARGAWPLSIGAISGAMNSCLAMPGPIPAAWMSGAGYSKDAVRATVLTLLLFFYPAAFALQWFAGGLEARTVWLSAVLAPATLAGVLVGRLLVRRVTEGVFRRFLVVVLAATVLGLFHSAFRSLVAM